ncbi:glycosyltransferase family 2 protein [Sulfitobacter aestuarii]|uniref:Glycosyltransferase family 2 protein n=1 Tax=Sulfitobacter aestuarii TaxID=2161676 RepID=A0ABW5U3U9_9RHOB
MSEPAVSIVIAAWNAEQTLRRALASAAAQMLPVEIILVDDASSDGTLALAREMAAADDRIVVLEQSRNLGPAAARNRAIAAARAPWVAILDADDFMAPDRLARLLDLALGQDADFVADDLYKVAEAAPDGPRQRMFSDHEIGLQWLDTAAFVNANLSARHGGRRELGFLKPLMRRRFLSDHALTYADIRLGEDYVLYASALARGARFLLTDPAGYCAVVRPHSLSGAHPTSAHAALIAADRDLLALPDLPAEARQALRAHLAEQQKKWAWRRLIDAGRERDYLRAIGCFWAPPPVAVDTAGRLAQELMRRARRGASAS